MKSIILKTIVHLEDDKGWKHEKEFEGEHPHIMTYRIPKKLNVRSDSLQLKNNEPIAIPNVSNMYYEFSYKKEKHEKFSQNYYIKHLYYEM